MDISNLSLVELKALAFDMQNNLQVLGQEIQKRMQAEQQKPAQVTEETKDTK